MKGKVKRRAGYYDLRGFYYTVPLGGIGAGDPRARNVRVWRATVLGLCFPLALDFGLDQHSPARCQERGHARVKVSSDVRCNGRMRQMNADGLQSSVAWWETATVIATLAAAVIQIIS
jgi:hypothetical protein